MLSRASVAALLLLLALPLPGRAFDRAAALSELRAVQPRLTQLDQAPTSLKAIDKTLSSAPPADKELFELKGAAVLAMQAQGRPEFPSRVDKVRELLNRLFPAGVVGSASVPVRERLPADLKGARSVTDPRKWAQAIDGGQSRRFWDLDAASGGESGVPASGSGGKSGSSAILSTQQKGLKVAAVPATDKTLSDPGSSCRQALAGHPRIAALCREHPRLAPLIAGVAEAFKAQFGTIEGIATNLLFLLIGLVMSAISGIGLIAKIAVSLVSLAMAAMVLGPLIKEGWDAFGAYRRSGKGTAQESASLLRMGKVGGAVLILALMSFIGYKVGKSRPGQEAVKSMTAALSAKLGKPAAAGTAAAGGRLSGALKEAIPAKDPVGLGHGQTQHVNVGEAGLLKQIASGKGAATEFVDQAAFLRTRELAWAKLRAVGEGDFSGVLGKAGDVSAGLERLVLDGNVKNAGFAFKSPVPVGRGFVAPQLPGAPAAPVSGIENVFVAFSRQPNGKLFIRTIYPKAN